MSVATVSKKAASIIDAAAASVASEIKYNTFGKAGGKTNGVFTVLPAKKIHIIKDFNPRKRDLDEEAIAELRASMKKNGLKQPIGVRPHPDKVGDFAVVFGARRYRCAKDLGWDNLPVLVQSDLEDDFDAKAVAVLENSDDARKELTHMDLGRQFIEFEDAKKWTPAEIAGKTGYHVSKVRRCLELARAAEEDPAVAKRVEAGMSLIAGLQYAKLDKDVRAKIDGQIDADTSKATITALAKEATRGVEHAPGKRATANKSKKSRNAALIAWKPAKMKQAYIVEVANILVNREKLTPDNDRVMQVQLAGVLFSILWDRGDMEIPYVEFIGEMFEKNGDLVLKPDEKLSPDMKKQYKSLVAIIKAEADKAEKPEAPATEGDGAEADTEDKK